SWVVLAAVTLLGLVRAAVERVGHQLRFRAPGKRGAKRGPFFARLGGADSCRIFEPARPCDRMDETLAGPGIAQFLRSNGIFFDFWPTFLRRPDLASRDSPPVHGHVAYANSARA